MGWGWCIAKASRSGVRDRASLSACPWALSREPLSGGLRFAYGTGIDYTSYRAILLSVAE